MQNLKLKDCSRNRLIIILLIYFYSSANVSVESVGVLGLSNYIIEKANFTLNGFKMNVSLDWSEIQGKLNGYSILGKLMDFLDVYGIGDAE